MSGDQDKCMLTSHPKNDRNGVLVQEKYFFSTPPLFMAKATHIFVRKA